MNERQIDRLLTAVAQHDSHALGTLYALTKNGVYAFLYPFFGNCSDTEDCLQDVYMKVMKSAESYRAGTNGRAWLLQIAKNTALDEKRKQKRVVYTDALPEQPPPEREQTPVFDALKNALDAEEQRIVVLHVLWGYKHREIAEYLGCPLGTVTAKYKRAVDKLKKYIKENEA